MSCEFLKQKHHFIEYEYGFYCQFCGKTLDKKKKEIRKNPYNFSKCGLCKKERKGNETIAKNGWAYFPVCMECYLKTIQYESMD